MNKIFQIILFTVLFSCNNIDHKNEPETSENIGDALVVKTNNLNEVFKVDSEALTKDFMTWYTYTYNKIHLSQDFIALDVDSLKIDKLAFLKKLESGRVIPFKIKMVEGQPVYKLYDLVSKDESIKATMKQMASTEIAYLKMEGTEMPAYNFTDINENVYTKSSTKGKLVVLKCWFIHCAACVKEFPELNKLVDDNKNVQDLIFISLAMDAKSELQKFLKTKEFKYAVVPEMKNFMVDKLGVTEFPTHVLINGDGKIIKVVNRIDDLIPFLNIEKTKIGS